VRFDLLRDRVKVRPFAGFEFGVNEFTVDANFKGTAAGRDQPWLHARRFLNESGQPGRLRLVVSVGAVFDRYFWFHGSSPYSATLFAGCDSVEGWLVYLGRGSKTPSLGGSRKSHGRIVEIGYGHRYPFLMQTSDFLVMAVIEQAGVATLRIAFTLALFLFVLGGVFIFRRRHQFFDRDPDVENDFAVVRHNREEMIIFVGSALMLVLVGILHQVWSA
jgi:hypothetical protein